MTNQEERDLKHVGIIMDGNRRWAVKHGVSKYEGHRSGYKTLKELLKTVKELNIDYVSVYAFSTENWNRSKEEVEDLLAVFRWGFGRDLKNLIKEGVRVKRLGRRENVPNDLLKMIDEAEEKTKHFTNGTLALCFNYGGKQEIVDALKAIVEAGEEVTEQTISDHLYEAEIPPIDLIIRTSGEQRLSNFMLWRADYAELHFTDTLWPDFNGEELTQIVAEYKNRDRRYGK